MYNKFCKPRQDGKTIMANASCCLWQPSYYTKASPKVKHFFHNF